MPFSKINLDAEISIKLQKIIDHFNAGESLLLSLLGEGREKMLAITNQEQSYAWAVRSLEREQMEKTLASGNYQPAPSQLIPKIPYPTLSATQYVPTPPTPPLSSEATILAESRKKLEESIKDLTLLNLSLQ